VDKEDRQVYKDNPGFCKFPDFCGGIEASKPEAGMVVFKLPKMEVGLVIICGCCGKQVAQSMFMKESESLAALIQQEIDKESSFPNRGVKQAGFYVLVGASMPNVLIEVGFLSNPSEEKQLRSTQYRQKIANGIYRAIIEFKKSREFVMADG
jgi:N-acetylmuramoyl-L-alanine amidase